MIETCGLGYDYRAKGRHGRVVHAVRDISMTIDDGEVIGFLGPNGAGKTTTMRMLATLLHPSAGQATIGGCDLLADPVGVRKKIGYVAQGPGTSDDSTVTEELVLQARLYGMGKNEARRRSATVAEQLDLGDVEKRPTGTLSGGERRRLDIALALIHQPRLILLDEPTAGLDPPSRSGLWNHIRRLCGDSGVTVFLTTHYLDEADSVADRIIIMDHGQIIARGSPRSLRDEVVPGEVINVDLPAGDVVRAVPAVERVLAGSVVLVDGQRITVHAPVRGTALPMLLRTLDALGIHAISANASQPTLDDVFSAVTERHASEVPGGDRAA